MTTKHALTADDIVPTAEYAPRRTEHRRRIAARKRNRRVEVGPVVTFYFECWESMWLQVQEMLRIKKGGEEQIAGELAAYNPLIPQGTDLIATMMIEIEDENLRRRTLASLGHIEDMVHISFTGHTVKGVPEADIDHTTEEGKTSSVHFLHFAFTPVQVTDFKAGSAQVAVGILHPSYGHMAVLSEESRAALAADLA